MRGRDRRAFVPDRIEVMLPLNSARDLKRILPALREMDSVVLFLRNEGVTLQNYPGESRRSAA
jgi:hypothetical protein